MAELSLTHVRFSPRRYVSGLGLAMLLAAAALWLSNQPAVAASGLGALTLAMIAGIVAGNTFYGRLASCDAGVQLAKKLLLRAGIVLYGFRLTFQQIADIGFSGVLTDLLLLSSTFLLACWLGRRVLGLDRDTVWLIGAGSSICGAAAIMATEPVIKAEAPKVAIAIATVVLFGTIGIFLYPLLWHWCATALPGITPAQWGIFTGSTLHEVAQVVAAGHAVSPETENAAVITKMLRVMLLAPFLLILTFRVGHTGQRNLRRISFPWFALGFIGVALFNSLHLLPTALVNEFNKLDNFLLAVAMAALGLTTQFSQLKKAGIKPVLLGAALFVWLMVGGGAINLAIQHLLA